MRILEGGKKREREARISKGFGREQGISAFPHPFVGGQTTALMAPDGKRDVKRRTLRGDSKSDRKKKDDPKVREEVLFPESQHKRDGKRKRRKRNFRGRDGA